MVSTPRKNCVGCGKSGRYKGEKCIRCRELDNGEYRIEDVDRMLTEADRRSWNLPPLPKEDCDDG